MIGRDLALLVLAFLLTYVVYSSAMITLAWLVCRFDRLKSAE